MRVEKPTNQWQLAPETYSSNAFGFTGQLRYGHGPWKLERKKESKKVSKKAIYK